MASVKYELDMSRGSIFKTIMRFVVPLIATNVLQVLYNAADMVVVGRWTGGDALAAVGATSSLYNLLVNVFIGLALGAGVVVSRRYGARDNAGIHRAVHTSIFLSICVGLFACVMGLLFTKPLLEIMGTPEGKVLDGAVLYMRILFVGVPASMIYNFGASILRAMGDTRRPLYILATTGIINVVLNLILVIGFHMGVAGVAIATVVANYLSMLAVLAALLRADSSYHLELSQIRVYKAELVEIAKVGIPAGIQSSVFSLSNTVIQSSINSFGTTVMMGNTAAHNIESFVYTAMNSFYQATLTAVSQNYGAKNEKRIYRAIVISLACAAILGAALGGVVFLFAKPLLGIYIVDSPEAMAYGITRLLFVCLPYFFCGVMEVMTGAIRGLGYSTITTVNSLVGACGFRMLWVFSVLAKFHRIEVLFACYPLSWILVILMHTVCFFALRKRAMGKMYAAQ